METNDSDSFASKSVRSLLVTANGHVKVPIPTYQEHKLAQDTPDAKILIMNYLKIVAISVILALLGWLMIFLIDRIPWDDLSMNSYTLNGRINTKIPENFNRSMYTLLTAIIFVFALPGYVLIKFKSTYGENTSTPFSLICFLDGIAIGLAFFGLWASQVQWWYYYIDVIILVVAFSSSTFAAGYFAPDAGCEDKLFLVDSFAKPKESKRKGSADSTSKQIALVEERQMSLAKRRLWEGIDVTLTEVVVFFLSVIYCFFLMPIYQNLDNDFQRILWRLIYHPAYMELLKTFVRQLMVRRAGKNLNVVHSLVMAQCQARITVIQANMIASLSDLSQLTATVVLIQFTRMFWRTTAIHRFTWSRKLFALIGRLLKLKGAPTFEETTMKADKFKFIYAIEMQVDMLMESAATGFAFYMCWTLSDTKLFMFPVSNKMDLPYVFAAIAIQLSFQWVCDALCLIFNSKYVAKLPFQNTFRDMWAVKWHFFGHISYALLVMGLASQLYLMARVPRAGLCSSFDPCSCALDIGKELCRLSQ